VTVLKGRCRKCDHLFTWDEKEYSKQNHIVKCKECKGFIGGGFQCGGCGNVVALLVAVPPESCFKCGSSYDEHVEVFI
jgi:hypothetical protein